MMEVVFHWTLFLIDHWPLTIDHYFFLSPLPSAREPTNEARAETKLVWAMPCKEEEGRRSNCRNGRDISHTDPTDLTDYIFHAEQLEQWEESDARINYPESWQRKTIVKSQKSQKVFNKKPGKHFLRALALSCLCSTIVMNLPVSELPSASRQ